MPQNKKNGKKKENSGFLPKNIINQTTDSGKFEDPHEALRKREKLYRSFFEKARDPILLIDNSFHFIDCNEAALKILGAVSKDQVINKPPTFFSPKYQPDGQLSETKAAKMIKNAYKKGSLQFEWVHKRINGAAIYMDVSLTIIPTENKNVLLVNWRDITESKKAGETISKLYQAIEQTNEIVFMTDVDGTINFVNAAFEEIYGYKKDEIVGKTTPRILKSGVMKKKFYEELWEKLPAGKGLHKEIVNKTKEGRLIDIHTSLSPIFNDRQILIGYMAVQEDITEKKIAQKKLLDAELQYRTLFEQSPDGICLVDIETFQILDFNEKACIQLGYSPKEFNKLKISDFEIIETPEAISERAKKIINRGYDDFKTAHKTKSGETKDIHVIVKKILLHNKPVFYAIFRDITDKIRLEKILKEQQRKIMEATLTGQEKEKNELGKELHDNINQLLATAKIYLGMMKSKPDEPLNSELVAKSYEYVNIAIEEIRKLTHSLVAPALGEKNLHESLKEFIQEINSTDELNVKLVNEIKKIKIPDSKKELMIYRIIQEQMSNIRKHANAKTVIIHLKTKKENLFVNIVDDGIGFEPDKKGNGIGLKNIQSRVEFYSGNMNIISSPGNGCSLELLIPLKSEKIEA